MKIFIIGTVASSLYIFRKDLILSLIDTDLTAYAFTSDSNLKELNKIAKLNAIPSHYQLNRGGLSVYEVLSNTIKLYRQIKKLSPILFLVALSNLSSNGFLILNWIPRALSLSNGEIEANNQ
nr:glycosyltransferase family 4 protein [Moraxella osloensis]